MLLVALAASATPAVQADTLLGNRLGSTLGNTVGSTLGAVVDATTGLIAALPIKVPGLPRSSRLTTRVNGTTGGVAQCGRFRVVVPPGAYYGNADITITVPDGTTLACDLSISPASANGFAVPVRLEMDASGVNVDGGLLAGYYDPALGKWTRVAGSWENPNAHVVTAPLWHFSKYGGIPGRAGW